MNVLIVDDDIEFSQKLKNDFIINFRDVNRKNCIDIINHHFHDFNKDKSYDIAFLDIDLKTANGINIGNSLRNKNEDIILIYISAREDLVFETLSTDVFQFIRKSQYNQDKIKVFNQLEKKIKRFLVHHLVVNGERITIELKKIKYILSLGKDVDITENKTISIRSSMKDVLSKFDFPCLVQIQRGTIINLYAIVNVDKGVVYTNDNKRFKIGKKYLSNFYDQYEEFLLR